MLVTRFDANARLCDMVAYRDLVIVSGQVPDSTDGSIQDQTREVLDKLDGMLARAGTNKANILSVTVYLTDFADYDGLNAVWDAWVDSKSPPARDCFIVGLAKRGWKVEITAMACRNQ